MKILVAYGTRPEYIKIKPLLEAMNGKIEYKILFTGQHVDIAAGNFDFKTTIQDGFNRLDSVVQSNLNLPNEFFEGITHVLVQGDTSSALALALASFHRQIKVIHLEAGLRTYDFQNPYPEEMNRQLIGRLADIHFCPTFLNSESLKCENIKENIYVVGNTGLDSLLPWRKECEYTNKILITLHRRENHNIIDQWFKSINDLAISHPDLEFIFPIHPNPNVQKHKNILTHVRVIEPLPHEELLKILVKSKFLISDSGGLQEETSFLFKKIIVCRKETERGESLEYTSFLCPEPGSLNRAFNFVNNYFDKDIHSIKERNWCPYGDGKASEKIVEILLKMSAK